MRFIATTHIFLQYFVFYRFGSGRNKSIGERLRLAFESLGITYIKIGQALSMRYDIFSQKDCEELQKLLEKTNEIPFEVISNILNREYKGTYSRFFKEIDRVPLGSASVSQVHKAVLHDGRIVAVKVKRPHVHEYIERDTAIFRRLAKVASLFSQTLRAFRILEVIDFTEKWVKQEVDFSQEIESIKAMKNFMSDSEENHGYVCLDVVEDLCTPHIIVMSFVDGVTLAKKKELETKENYDAKESVRNYLNVTVHYLFNKDKDMYYYQADPHLSNVMALPNGKVASIDYGLVCQISKKDMNDYKKLLKSIYLKDTEMMLEIVSDWSGKDLDSKTSEQLKKDLKRFYRKVDDEGINYWSFELTKIFLRNNVNYPSYLITMNRFNAIVDGLVSTYLPGYSLIDLLGKELNTYILKGFAEGFKEQKLLRFAHNFLNYLEDTQNKETFLQEISQFSKSFQGLYSGEVRA